MSCASCSARVEKAVSGLPGVTSCSVNLLTNSMVTDGDVDSETIIKAVERAGYGAKEKNTASSGKVNLKTDSEVGALLKRLIISAAFLVLLMYFSMGCKMSGWHTFGLFENSVCIVLLEFIISSVILAVNRKYFINGFKAAFHLSPNMDTLVALGSGVSYIYSIYILFSLVFEQGRGNGDFISVYSMKVTFDSSATIVTLITVGKYLEAVSKGKTKNALESILKLTPQTAIVIRNGVESAVPANEIRKDEIFILKPGASVPADGIVIEGFSSVNESSLTGESIPVEKREGDSVSSATVNINGYLKCLAVRVGDDTYFSKIVRMLEDAGASKPPIARIADKVASVFVPAVITLSIITFILHLLNGFLFSSALQSAISVLVISCPCALGLATPVAVMVGTGIGAKNGILFKNAESLETAGRVKTVVFDKTGTLTSGKPQVTDIISFDGYSSEELLFYAAVLEKKSEHPVSSAIITFYSEKFVEPLPDCTDFNIYPGNGLSCIYESKLLLGGSYTYIKSQKEIIIPENAGQVVDSLSGEGKTPVFFSVNNHVMGIIAVRDDLRADSVEAVEVLGKMGLEVVMLTGDNSKTAQAIAGEAGISRVVSSVLPDKKNQVVEQLRKDGVTAMVGDGINDSLALMSADVGMALAGGADVALDSSDIVLVRNSLTDVVSAIQLSKRTMRTIRQNLFWAFIYNIICIPLAMGLFGVELKPVYGALAMSLSSFCVCINALRLNLFRPYNINNNKISEGKKMKRKIFVSGMSCPHCEKRVKDALLSVHGVIGADVSFKTGLAEVEIASSVPEDVLREAIEAQGYTVTEIN